MNRLPLNRASIEMLIFLFLLYIIWVTTAYNIRKTDIYHSSLLGNIEDVHTDYRNRAKVKIKFKNTDKLNQLSLIFNIKVFKDKRVLVKEDSISKRMFTLGYDVYRKNDGEYKFLYHLDSD
ncbi:MAG: hypothetical protein PHC38_11565 [Weeksellaceae bacterium]|jgi:hypothetical protein|nr:hypothetical protein [Weeksellaceae bacterium]